MAPIVLVKNYGFHIILSQKSSHLMSTLEQEQKMEK